MLRAAIPNLFGTKDRFCGRQFSRLQGGCRPSGLGSLTRRERAQEQVWLQRPGGGRPGTCLKIIALGGTGEQAKAGTPSVSGL